MKKLIATALIALALTACQDRIPYALASVQATLEERCANYGGVEWAGMNSIDGDQSVEYFITYTCRENHSGKIRMKEAKR